MGVKEKERQNKEEIKFQAFILSSLLVRKCVARTVHVVSARFHLDSFRMFVVCLCFISRTSNGTWGSIPSAEAFCHEYNSRISKHTHDSLPYSPLLLNVWLRLCRRDGDRTERLVKLVCSRSGEELPLDLSTASPRGISSTLQADLHLLAKESKGERRVLIFKPVFSGNLRSSRCW